MSRPKTRATVSGRVQQRSVLLLVTGLVLCAESSPPPVPAPSPPLAPVHEVVVQQAFEAEPNVEMDSVVSATLRSRLALAANVSEDSFDVHTLKIAKAPLVLCNADMLNASAVQNALTMTRADCAALVASPNEHRKPATKLFPAWPTAGAPADMGLCIVMASDYPLSEVQNKVAFYHKGPDGFDHQLDICKYCAHVSGWACDTATSSPSMFGSCVCMFGGASESLAPRQPRAAPAEHICMHRP